MTGAQADRLHYYLLAQEGVMKVTVSERTMDATILFEPGVEGARDAVVTALASFDLAQSPVDVPDHTGRELNRDFEDKLFFLVARRAACMFVLPPILRNLVPPALSCSCWTPAPFWKNGHTKSPSTISPAVCTST